MDDKGEQDNKNSEQNSDKSLQPENGPLSKGDVFNLLNKLSKNDPIGNPSEDRMWTMQGKIEYAQSKPEGISVVPEPIRKEEHDTIIEPDEHN